MRKVNSEPQGGWDAKTFSDERNLKGNKPIIIFIIKWSHKKQLQKMIFTG